MTQIRRVTANLVADVQQHSRAVLQVAVADVGLAQEVLAITLNGRSVEPDEVSIPGEGRTHVFATEPGRLEVSYEATITGRAEPESVSAVDEIVYLRPSRYAESDRLGAVAAAEFAGIHGRPELLAAVSSWVGTRLLYVPGSSGPTDGAADTLLQRSGVCRDYAHLVTAFLRAMDVPARMTAVYAPGLNPMDFHAVVEAAVDGRWFAVDATLLAPRSTLVRICAGRDAADTAFLSTYGGAVDLLESWVTAIVEGDLPIEDVSALVALG